MLPLGDTGYRVEGISIISYNCIWTYNDLNIKSFLKTVFIKAVVFICKVQALFIEEFASSRGQTWDS